MKINYALVSRSLIALLFVVAGVQKIMDFSNTVTSIGKLGVPAAALATILVILVEVPVALAFAWGYKTRIAGYILIGFTVLATLLAHTNFSTAEVAAINMIMILKNIAIVGGIMAALACVCDDCTVHAKKKNSN